VGRSRVRVHRPFELPVRGKAKRANRRQIEAFFRPQENLSREAVSPKLSVALSAGTTDRPKRPRINETINLRNYPPPIDIIRALSFDRFRGTRIDREITSVAPLIGRAIF